MWHIFLLMELQNDFGGESFFVDGEAVLERLSADPDADALLPLLSTLVFDQQESEANGGITIEEEAETGTVISGRLLTIGTELQEGKIAEDAAIAEARALIEQATAPGAGRSATEPAGQSAY